MSRMHEAMVLYLLFGMGSMAVALAAMTKQNEIELIDSLQKSMAKNSAPGPVWLIIVIAVLLWITAWPAVVIAFLRKKRNA